MKKRVVLARAASLVSLLLVSSCRGREESAPSSAAAATTSAIGESALASASASTSASARPPLAAPPLLALEEAFPDKLKGWGAVFDVDGELLVSNANEVYRLNGDALERVGEVEKHSPNGGSTTIELVAGHYPDALDVTFRYANGRIPTPTYRPLTGKGDGFMFGGGGGMAYIAGVAHRDGSTVLLGDDYWHHAFVTVRGKSLPLTQIGRTKRGCPAKQNFGYEFEAAITPLRLASLKDGTIAMVGFHCTPDADKTFPAVELWTREPESRVIPLNEWHKSLSSACRLLPGPGRFWISGRDDEPVLELKDGAIRPLPKLPKVATTFLGPDATLYASDGVNLHHWIAGEADDGAEAQGQWQRVATLGWPARLATLALHDGVFWGSAEGTVYKLVPAAPIELSEGCTTPFVHLFDVKSSMEPGYTFPNTRKALAGFDRKADVSLVEFSEGGRRLGVKVPDRASGEAVVAMIKANMKDESPKLICYAPTKVLRTFPIK